MGRDMADVIRQQAGLFCKDMIEYTPPLANGNEGPGNTLDARNRGRAAIRKSVFKLFRTQKNASPSQIADADNFGIFKMWLQEKNPNARASKAGYRKFQQSYGRGNRVAFIERGDLGRIGELHTGAREDGGHGRLKSIYRAKSGQPIGIADERDLEKYIKSKYDSVGRLKSPYFHAAERIGAKQAFPAWVKHASGAQQAIAINQLSDPIVPSVTVGNLIGKKVLRGFVERNVQRAINYRAYGMRNAMAKKLNKDKEALWQATAKGTISGTSQYFK